MLQIFVEFYQKIWDLVQRDLLRMLDDFRVGTLSIQRLNYDIITLLPKCKTAAHIYNFRPICLLNVSFKILSKVLMNRLNRVVGGIISQSQTTFIKDIYILERVLVLHETHNTLHREKSLG